MVTLFNTKFQLSLELLTVLNTIDAKLLFSFCTMLNKLNAISYFTSFIKFGKFFLYKNSKKSWY